MMIIMMMMMMMMMMHHIPVTLSSNLMVHPLSFPVIRSLPDQSGFAKFQSAALIRSRYIDKDRLENYT